MKYYLLIWKSYLPLVQKKVGGGRHQKNLPRVGGGLWITYRLAKTRILDKNSTTQTQDNQYKYLKNQK